MKYIAEKQARVQVVLAILVLVAMMPTADVAAAFRFAVIGDRTGNHVEGVYGEILDEVQRLRPDFVMTVGDMIEGYTEDSAQLNSEWQEYLGLLDGLSMPIYYTPGNHDITNEVMRPFYERYIGEPYHSFDYDDCHFVIIDNAPGGGGSAEPLPEEQWNWLVDDLAKHADAAHTFAFCHKPFWYENRFEGKPDSLHDLLVQYGVDAVFTGHYHRYFTAELDGILYTGVGSSGGGARSTFEYLQYHFMWVTVDEQGIAISPIDKSSVQPWDYTTAEDIQLAGLIWDSCINVNNALRVGRDQRIDDYSGFVVRNLSQTMRIEDTLRWEERSGWTFEPTVVPVSLGPGEEMGIMFEARCETNPFPPPVLKLRHPLTDGVYITVEKSLWLARTVHSIWSRSAPMIDGNLSEPQWREPTTTLFSPEGSQMATDSVWFFFAHDLENLYLGAVCREPIMDSLRAKVTERDGSVYGEDCVGCFFCSDPQADTVFQIYINPLGSVFDQRIVWRGGDYDSDRSWDGDYEIATLLGDGYWTVEARISLSELGAGGRTSGSWLVNFRRKQKRLNSSADWQVPIDYDPHTYGYLKFGD